MSKFKIDRSWVKNEGRSASDVTLARVKISVADRVVTEWVSDHEEGSDVIEAPVYFLAEWLAENWWPLLWEPRKSEEVGDNSDFLSRHSLLTAQHGIPLPAIMIIPQGNQIAVSAKARNVLFADCRFRVSADAMFPRKDIESELRKFVTNVVKKLDLSEITGTDLQEAWSLITSTGDDEVDFCRLAGALGASPYALDEKQALLLEEAAERHSFETLLDLCQTSTPNALTASLQLADKARELTANAPEAELEPLFRRSPPADNLHAPGWRHGVNAAKAARAALDIRDSDPKGASQLFDALQIDLTFGSDKAPLLADNFDGEDSGFIVGAVEREDSKSKIALLQQSQAQRRFTAARATYLAWTSDSTHTSRLLTSAVTRDQQASRAFAAELVAPVNYIRAQAAKHRLTSNEIYAIANELCVSPGVIRKQAINNNIMVAR